MAIVPETLSFIGLGSNLGRPFFQLKNALATLAHLRGVRVLECSSIYESDPIGYTDQPVFMNAVAKILIRHSPHRLLDILQAIEIRHHRIRTSNQNSARTLDLDILVFGQLRCVTERLILPHPQMLKRRFVLQPLLEISPDQSIPGKGPAINYLPCVIDQRCQRKSRILLK